MKKLTFIFVLISCFCFAQDWERIAKLGTRFSELEGMLYQLEVKLKNKTISSTEMSKAFTIINEMLQIEPEYSQMVEDAQMRANLLSRKKAFSSFHNNTSNSTYNNNSNNSDQKTNSDKKLTPLEIELKYDNLENELIVLEALLETKNLAQEEKNKAIEICNEFLNVPQSLADKLNLDSREYYIEKRNLFQNYAASNNSNSNYVKPKNENTISLPPPISKTVECANVLTFRRSYSSYCQEYQTLLVIENNSPTDLWVRIYCPISENVCNAGLDKVVAGKSKKIYCVDKNFTFACKTQQQFDNTFGWPKFAGYKE